MNPQDYEPRLPSRVPAGVSPGSEPGPDIREIQEHWTGVGENSTAAQQKAREQIAAARQAARRHQEREAETDTDLRAFQAQNADESAYLREESARQHTPDAGYTSEEHERRVRYRPLE